MTVLRTTPPHPRALSRVGVGQGPAPPPLMSSLRCLLVAFTGSGFRALWWLCLAHQVDSEFPLKDI